MYSIDGNLLNGIDLASYLAKFKTYSLGALVISLIIVIELWVIFKKCGKPGVASIIPIWNVWTLFEVSGIAGWLCLIPIANFIGILVAYFKLPKRFNKSAALGLGILFLPVIFLGVLALSKTSDKKEEVKEETPVNNTPNPALDTVPDLMAEQTPMTNNQPINEMVADKEFVKEEPALNTTEPVSNNPLPKTEEVVEVKKEEPIINAFEMPAPRGDNQVINDMTPEVKEEVLDVLDDQEEPTTVNEAINSDITIPKKCPACGNDNKYTNKVCDICGANLE